MAGELPFEKPLSELRKKIEELKKFGAEKQELISPMKSAGLEERCTQLEEEALQRADRRAEDAYGASSSAVRPRLITSKRYSPISSSCTGTGCLRTIWRLSAVWPS